jgi:hypothetical protein
VGFFDFITDFFDTVSNVVSTVVGAVVDIFTPSQDFGAGSTDTFSQDALSPIYELGNFRNIVSNMVPSALIWTEDGMRVPLKRLWGSDPGTTQRQLLEIGAGELETVNGTELNGDAISTFTGSSETVYTGTSSQAIDSRYDASPNDIGGLRDTAYLALTLEASEKLTGDPLVTTNVAKGRKIPLWNGADWTTLASAASGNPAAVIRDYLLLDREQGGAGLVAAEIDDASFGVVYTWAEVSVSDGAGGTEPRARVTFSLDSFKPWTEVLEDVLMSFGGFIVTDGKVLKLKVRKSESSVQDFEPGKMTGTMLPGSFGYYTFSKQERPNRIIGIYKDPTDAGNDAWTRTPVIDDYADQQTNPRGVVTKEVTYRAISRQSQAIRMVTQVMNDHRVNWFGCKFKTDIDSAARERGDVIRIKHPILGDGATWYEFTVERVVEYPDHTREITAKAYNSTIFNDSLEADPVALAYVRVANPFTATDEVTSLAITEEGGFVNEDGTWYIKTNGTFTAPNQTLNLTRYRVLVKEDSGAYEFVKYVSSPDTSFDLGIVAEVGKSYTVKVQTENDRNILSDGAESNTITIVGKDVAPSAVSGFTVVQEGDNLRFKWNAITDKDLFGYKISSGAVYATSIPVTEDFLGGIEYIETAATNGTKTFWIVAVDNSGNVSTEVPYSIDVEGLTTNIAFSSSAIDMINDITERNNIAIEHIPVSGFNSRTIPSFTNDTVQQWDDITDLDGVLWDFPVLPAAADFTTEAFDLGGVATGKIELTIGTVLTGVVDFVIEINTADTLTAWNGWQVFTTGNYTCRYYKFKVSFTPSNVNTGKLNVYSLRTVFDVIDKVETGIVTITNASTGLAITYATPFAVAPSITNGTLELYDADDTKYLHPKSFSEAVTGFTIKATDITTGSLATGTVRYRANGYVLNETVDFNENLGNIAENLTNAAIEYIADATSRSRTIPSITIDTSQQWDDTTNLENAVWGFPVLAAEASFTTTAFDVGQIATGRFNLTLTTVLAGTVTSSIEINRSDDDITYNGYESFTSGNTYNGRYFKFRFKFTSDNANVSTINYTDFALAVSGIV